VWEGRLAVRADHAERRQEDGLERHEQGQGRPGVSLDEQHPDAESDKVQVHERIDPAKAVMASAILSWTS
jgi:hypothetical protein